MKLREFHFLSSRGAAFWSAGLQSRFSDVNSLAAPQKERKGEMNFALKSGTEVPHSMKILP